MIRTGSITSSGRTGYLAAPVQHGASTRVRTWNAADGRFRV